MSERKILTLDIETSPHLCYSFQTWKTTIFPMQILEPTRVICWAAKWRHRNSVIFDSEYEEFGPQGGAGFDREFHHRNMIEHIHALLDEADVVVTYNGDKFDLPHLYREFNLIGLKDPSPYISVDLYKVVKGRENWLSHKLAYITERKGLSGKMDNSGWRLWLGVLSPDPEVRRKAWREMRRYNKQDVVVTEELFDEELPNVKNLPAASLWDEVPNPGVCPACKGEHVQRRGFAYTKTRRYPRFQCQAPTCGKWFKGVRSEGSAGVS